MRIKLALFCALTILLSAINFAQQSVERSIVAFDFTKKSMLKASVEAKFTQEGLIIVSEKSEEILEFDPIESPIKNARPFLAVGFNVEKGREVGELSLQYAFSKDGKAWTDWKNCDLEIDGGEGSEGYFRYYSESLALLESSNHYVKYRLILYNNGGEFPVIKNVRVTFISPGETPADLIEKNTVPAEESLILRKGELVTAYTRPSYINRAGWACPGPENSTARSTTTVTHLVVHHSSDSYDPNNPNRDYAAVVRSYYNYHVNTNGWADIGYNWIVDPKGVLYKGRAWYNSTTENVIGAHNSSKNSNCAGISIIGNYSTYQPTAASLNMLYEILAFLCDKYSIAPKGTSYHAALGRNNENIDGHEGSGGGTACPGTNLISKYSTIRQAVYDKLFPSAVTLSSPANGATGLSLTPTLSWQTLSGATNYNVQVSKTSAFSSTTVNVTVTTTSYAIPIGKLAGNTTYYWRVKANNATDWSTVRNFKTSDIKYWTQWAFAEVNSNKPAWMGENTERGLAYLNNELLVVSRKDALTVKRLSYSSGAETGSLNVSGISGGTYALNDVEVSSDGQILACNLTTNAQTSAFKIYKWTDVSSAPTAYISYSTEAFRLGDNFTVVGSLAGNAVIYAAASNTNKVLRWTVTSGTLNSTPTVITLSGVTSVGSPASVAPLGSTASDDFYVNGTQMPVTLFSSTGTNKGSIEASVVPNMSVSIKAFTQGSSKFLAVFQAINTSGDPNGQNMKLVDVTNGPSGANLIFTTPRLGNVSNPNCAGDIAFRIVANAPNMFFVLATNNGIAAYGDSYNAVYSPAPVIVEEEIPVDYALMQNYPNPFNPATTISYKIPNAANVSLKVYNMLGDEIATLVNETKEAGVHTAYFDASNLASGIYICRLQAGSFAKSIKMSLVK